MCIRDRSRLNLINLPSSLKEASLAQVYIDDVGRRKAFVLLSDFVAKFPHYQKAVYLYGDFGVGKSYMMAALAHDLSEKRSVSTTLLHYPSFVLDVKNAISSGLVKELSLIHILYSSHLQSFSKQNRRRDCLPS